MLINPMMQGQTGGGVMGKTFVATGMYDGNVNADLSFEGGTKPKKIRVVTNNTTYPIYIQLFYQGVNVAFGYQTKALSNNTEYDFDNLYAGDVDKVHVYIRPGIAYGQRLELYCTW